MKPFAAFFILMTLAHTAMADEKDGVIALEPYFAFAQFGDIESTISWFEGPKKRDLEADTTTLAAGLKFIVPASERFSIRGRLAYAHLSDEIKYPQDSSGFTSFEESKRDGVIGEISVRYWLGDPKK